ncbi:MAG: spore photoproduct lyase family protein [Acidobacteriota bacterium]
MTDVVYVEDEVRDHPRTRQILDRLPHADVVACGRWGEVFNRRNQDFRLQKRRPALILAAKHGEWVLPTPVSYGIGGRRNVYFSHMLNCPYDCRYCFLQGMFRSAHHVVFVNIDDLFAAIDATLAEHADDEVYFFSGYDCDSLAFDRVTGFLDTALPFFRDRPRAWLEIRTKSTQTRALLDSEPFANAVVAYSFTPDATARALEHRVPSVARRIDALATLAKHGWAVGMRFDPLIYTDDYATRYRELFEAVFASVPDDRVHSVSLGPFRLPTGFARTVEKLYPDEPLFAGPLEKRGDMVSYRRDLEEEMVTTVTAMLGEYADPSRFFPCELDD